MNKNSVKKINAVLSKVENQSEKKVQENEEELDNEPKIEPPEISDAERMKIILDKIAKGKLKNSYGQAIEKSSNEAQTTKM